MNRCLEILGRALTSALVVAVAPAGCGDDEPGALCHGGDCDGGAVPEAGRPSGGTAGTGGANGSGGAIDTGGNAALDGSTDGGGAVGSAGTRPMDGGGMEIPDAPADGGALCHAEPLGDLVTIPEGSELSRSPAPGATPYALEGFVDLDGVAFFVGRTREHGAQVYRTDGTAAGTKRVTELPKDGAIPQNVSVANGRLYFQTEAELWQTDGTTAGTVSFGEVRHPNFTDTGVYFERPLAGASPLYFTPGPYAARTTLGEFHDAGPFVQGPRFTYFIGSAAGADGVWRTDGTEAGTAALTGDLPAFAGGGMTRVGDRVYFFGPPTVNAGWDLYRVEASGVSATRVVDMPGNGFTDRVAVLNGRLVFNWRGPVGEPLGIWASDGTQAGTQELQNVATPAYANQREPLPAKFVKTPDRLHYALSGSANQLWTTDGTRAGTAPVQAVTGVSELTARGSELFLVNFERLVMLSPSSGLTEIAPEERDVAQVSTIGNQVYFFARTPEHDFEPWVTDGTLAGTHEVADVNTETHGADVHDVRDLPDGTVVLSTLDQHGRALWQTSGTAATTHRLSAADDGIPGFAAPFVTLGGRYVFTSSGQGPVLHVFDTETLVTTKVAGVKTTLGKGAPIGDRVVYVGIAPEGPQGSGKVALYAVPSAGLMSTPPTMPSAQVLMDLGVASHSQLECTPFDGVLFCKLVVGTTGSFPPTSLSRLIRTDGTPEGTAVLSTSPVFTAAPSSPGTFPVFDGKLYFSTFQAERPGPAYEMFSIESRTAPAVRVALPSGVGGELAHWAVLGDALYFRGTDPSHGLEVWKLSHGTAELVVDAVPGPTDGVPQSMTRIGEQVFYRVRTPTGRDVPWVTDGTAAGTHEIQSTAEGIVRFFGQCGGVYMTTGQEASVVIGGPLHRVDLAANVTEPLDFGPDVQFLISTENGVYLSVLDSAHGSEPWILH